MAIIGIQTILANQLATLKMVTMWSMLMMGFSVWVTDLLSLFYFLVYLFKNKNENYYLFFLFKFLY